MSNVNSSKIIVIIFSILLIGSIILNYYQYKSVNSRNKQINSLNTEVYNLKIMSGQADITGTEEANTINGDITKIDNKKITIKYVNNLGEFEEKSFNTLDNTVFKKIPVGGGGYQDVEFKEVKVNNFISIALENSTSDNITALYIFEK